MTTDLRKVAIRGALVELGSHLTTSREPSQSLMHGVSDLTPTLLVLKVRHGTV
jgi:hypothetical protein